MKIIINRDLLPAGERAIIKEICRACELGEPVNVLGAKLDVLSFEITEGFEPETLGSLVKFEAELSGSVFTEVTLSEQEKLALLKAEAFEALQKAESEMHKYASALDVGKDREKAFGCFENIRLAWRNA